MNITMYKEETVIKRFFLFCIAISVLVLFSGCGEGNPLPEPSATSPAAESEEPSPSAGTGPQASQSPEQPGTFADLRILFIDVGKADCALISFGKKHFLIDTGSSQSLPMAVRALRSLNVSTLEGVFLSHTHEDHTGGLFGLLRLFDVKEVYAANITENKKDGTNAVDETAGEAGKTVKRLKQGDEVVLDNMYPDVKFTVAGPLEYNADDDNDNSMVLYLNSGDFSCLFTGDMQHAEEKSLLDAGALKPCTVLKVGNHGNPDASSGGFISLVSPKYAVISTDSDVDTDTPAPSVLAELKKAGSKVFVTQDAVGGGILAEVKDGAADVGLFAVKTPPEAGDIVIESLDREKELLVLRNTGDKAADLTHWWILSERGGEMFFFPKGTSVQPDGTLSIASGKNPPSADLVWHDKNVWHDKKDDAAVVYDAFGNEVCRGE